METPLDVVKGQLITSYISTCLTPSKDPKPRSCVLITHLQTKQPNLTKLKKKAYFQIRTTLFSPFIKLAASPPQAMAAMMPTYQQLQDIRY